MKDWVTIPCEGRDSTGLPEQWQPDVWILPTVLTLHLSAPSRVTFILSPAQCLSALCRLTTLPLPPILHLLPGDRIWLQFENSQGRDLIGQNTFSVIIHSSLEDSPAQNKVNPCLEENKVPLKRSGQRKCLAWSRESSGNSPVIFRYLKEHNEEDGEHTLGPYRTNR
jgi:hypothetical protein